MNTKTIIIILILIVIAFFSFRSLFKSFKGGGCECDCKHCNKKNKK